MKALRFVVLLPALIALLSLLKPLLPSGSPIEQFVVQPSAIAGITLLSIVWFLYLSDYRYSRVILLAHGVSSFVATTAILAGHFTHTLGPLERVIVLPGNIFLLNLAYMFIAINVIQILICWLPHTKFWVNTLLGTILFMVLLSSFGHLYTLQNIIPQEALLLPTPFGAILGFLVLILAIFIYTNRMERLYLNPKIIFSFALMLTAVIAANVVVYKNIHNTVSLSRKIDTTRGTLANVYDAGLSLYSAQANVKTYIITADPAYIAKYKTYQQAYATTMAKTASQAAKSNQADIREHLQAVTDLGNHILSLSNTLITQKQHNTLSDTVRVQDNDELNAAMNQVLQEIKSVTTIYTNQVDGLAIHEAYSGRGIVLGISVSSALSILLIIFTPLFIRQTIRQLSLIDEKLKDSNTLLSDEKARAEAILSSIGEGLFAVDKQRVITLFNHGAEQLTGLRKADVLGRSYDEVLRFVRQGPERPDLDFTAHALAGKESHVHRNIAVAHTDGRKVDVQLSASPIRDRDHNVVGAIIAFRDRTSEQELESAKDEFVSLASHQLRTPATVTKQFLAMFLEGYAGEISDKQRLFLQQAYDNNELGINIIEDLLTIARLESNKIEVRAERISLNEFLEHSIQRHQTIAAKANQTIKLIVPKQIVYVDADASLLGMAVDNLISNALKYSFEGDTVTVKLTDRPRITLAVSDTGVGIKQADLTKIFQRFSRLQDPHAQHVSGTGIGLYLVKKVANMQHIKIKAASEYGKGSTFTLEFKASKG